MYKVDHEFKNARAGRIALDPDDARLLNVTNSIREPRSRLRRRVCSRCRSLADNRGTHEEPDFPGGGCAARAQLLARGRAPAALELRAWRHLPR